MTGIEMINKPNLKGFVINKPGAVIAVPIAEDGTLDWEKAKRNIAVINTITCTNTRTKTDILDGNSMYKAGDRVTSIAGTLAIEFSDIDLNFWGMAAGDGPNIKERDTMIKLFDPTRINDSTYSITLPYKYKEGEMISVVGIDGTEYTKATGAGGTPEVITVSFSGSATASDDGTATLAFDDGTVTGSITAAIESGDDKADVAAKLVAGTIPSAISEIYDVTLDTTLASTPKILFTAKAPFANRAISMATPVTYSDSITGPTASATVTTPGVAGSIGNSEYSISIGSNSTTLTFSSTNANKVVRGQFVYETDTVSYSQGKKTMAYHKFYIDHTWSDLANKQNFDVNIEISQAAMGADMVDTLSKDPSATKTLTFDIYAPLEGEQPYTVKINTTPIEND